ncbi:MAG: cbb3-type cytochrome c oxidase subunit 3 [Pseudomonadota bacterium]
MSAEALIGYAEAAFVVVGLLAIVLLLIRVYSPSNKKQMEDHANIPFRGEDAPEPPSSSPSSSRQKDDG